MKDPTFWILARASGLTAYALLTLSVLAGLVVKSKPFGKAVRQPTVTDLHRFLALLGLGAVAIHGITLVLDTTVKITPTALFVPGLVPYRPLWTALGVLGAELMILIYVSFGLRKRIGVKNWRRLHYATYLVFALATVHGLAAGTDSARPWAIWLYVGARRRGRRRDGLARADRRARPPRTVARSPAFARPRHRLANWRYLEMTTYRITIDRSLCSGFGSCVELAPRPTSSGRRHRQRPRPRDRRPERGRGRRHLPDGRHHGRGRRGRGGGVSAPRRVLIVGAGLAGARCAETLRAGGFDGELRLVAPSTYLRTSGRRSRRSTSRARAMPRRSSCGRGRSGTNARSSCRSGGASSASIPSAVRP